MDYRLALDLGSTSLGWAIFALDKESQPKAVMKAGVRIFSDGRNPKDGSSLAVSRREARSMRRRRDRLLKRKARMMRTLIEYGFLPKDELQRKVLEKLNPYELRAKGLDEKLSPEEFARALIHINQRRGFKSNRKTDKKENDSGALKTSILKVRQALETTGSRSIGEWLYKRIATGQPVRARYRQEKIEKDDGKTRIEKSYDLYVDRAMIEAEFDALWSKQTQTTPNIFNEQARNELKDCLLHQRPLKPVKPGRCTFIPEESRAPLALPSTQRFRMYQEVNNLRILEENLKEKPLTLEQRDLLIEALEKNNKQSFTQIKKLLGIGGSAQFNFEDPKRQELKGNTTGVILSKGHLFGEQWFDFDTKMQDEIVANLVNEENESKLITWLQKATSVDEKRAEAIANASLPEGYGSICEKALSKILPELKKDVVTYDKAIVSAGFKHHSQLSHTEQTGEILQSLPYYGIPLQRHVGFGSGDPKDTDEKRYGKIANPTVHIGLNQIRLVVNALIKKYGLPAEVIIEVARDLKQSKAQRDEDNKRQAENQKRNKRYRDEIANILNISEHSVSHADIQKMILWSELSCNEADRRCPYSGKQIGKTLLLSPEVEIEHILPYSQTLDDSLNNKTVAIRAANRIKGNRNPWDAKDDFEKQGWDYDAIILRAEHMPKNKRYRFGENGYQRWLKEDKDFLARALNDTRYLSRIAREYLSLICPGSSTRVIPGQMTALLRNKLGLNHVLGLNGEKNRNDHRHHAVDACVIGITDQSMLKRFANASANARQQQLGRLVESIPDPWPTYREHVVRAVNNIWVSHKPDHNHETGLHNDTAYGLRDNGMVGVHKMIDGKRTYIEENLKTIGFISPKATTLPGRINQPNQALRSRHGLLADGQPRPYKSYKGDSNYCIEIIRNTETGKWEGEVISTYDAYQLVRKFGDNRLRNPILSFSEKSLVMRLVIDDLVRFELGNEVFTMRITTIKSSGQILMASHNEANVDARNRNKEDAFGYISKTAGTLQKANARRITISPIGELRDPGFKE